MSLLLTWFDNRTKSDHFHTDDVRTTDTNLECIPTIEVHPILINK
jgi:hypothetical protein